MPRFVILRHDSPRGLHWDLMLEHEGVLATWELPAEPDRLQQPTSVRQLPDHRLDYLEYQGPISGGRGSVVQYDAGTYSLQVHTPDQWNVELCGERLHGRVVLLCESSDRCRWTFRFDPR